MHWVFEHVGYAVAAAAIAVFAGAFVWGMRRTRSWRWRQAVMLLLFAAACVALALAGLHIAQKNTRRVVILLDLSNSTRTSPWRDPAWLRELAQRRLGSDRILTVVAFASQPWVVAEGLTPDDIQSWPLVWPAPPAPSSTGRTDLSAALAWRSVQEQSTGALDPRWIVTDGLASAAVRTDHFPIACTVVPAELLDVGVRELLVRRSHAENDGGAGTGIEVLVELRATGIPKSSANHPLSLILHTNRDGIALSDAAITFESSPGQALMDASRWISIRDAQADAKVPHRYTVSVQGTPSDPWPENDHAEVLWVPRDLPRILVIGDSPAAAMVALPGATALSVNQFSIDAWRLATEGWQAIVLDDVPVDGPPGENRSILQPGAQQVLDTFVRQTGGGLLIAGRGRAFGPGGYGEPSGEMLESLSPVWSRPHQAGGVHLIFVLDASGSMNDPADGEGERKFRILAQGVIHAAEMLADDDRVTVITFNRRSETIVDAGAGKALALLPDALGRVLPTGPTVPDSALEPLAIALRDESAARQRLVILVTDGEIPAINAAHWKEALQSNEKLTTRLAIVAPAAAMRAAVLKETVLQKLIATVQGTTYWPSDDARTWARVLRQIIGEHVNGRRHGAAIAWQTVLPLPPATANASAWTDVWLKPEASLLAQGKTSASPILAGVVQRGLGQVAAMAFEDNAQTAAYRMFLADILARITAAPGDRRFIVAARRATEGDWILTADGADSHGFLNHEQLKAQLLFDHRTLPLFQTAPGHYEVHIAGEGALVGTLVRTSPEQLIGRFQTPAIATSEYPATVTRLVSARDMAADNVAIELPASPDDSSSWNPPASTMWSPAFYFWWAGAIFALLALGSRR